MVNLVTTTQKRIVNAESSTNLIFSAYVSNNDVVFKDILELYVKENSKIADVTYGKGVFWKKVDMSKYHVFPSGVQT